LVNTSPATAADTGVWMCGIDGTVLVYVTYPFQYSWTV